MKKFCVCALLTALFFGLVFTFGNTEGGAEAPSSYLRIHVRANSNSEEDQTVKYLVRDALVEYLTPLVAEAESKEEALSLVRGRLQEAEAVAEGVLLRNGLSYGASAKLAKEEFPTRVYEGATLPAGVYDAFILELGSGEGDNWWCVVYPPLCFAGGETDIIYKSKILEIIRSFFA